MICPGVNDKILTTFSESNKSRTLENKQVAIWDQERKIAMLEKQLAWEKMRADALDKMIDIAEEELDIAISKKPGIQQFNTREMSDITACSRFTSCSGIAGRLSISSNTCNHNRNPGMH